MKIRQYIGGILRGIWNASKHQPAVSVLALYGLLNVWLVGVALHEKPLIVLLPLPVLLLFMIYHDNWQWLHHFRREWLAFSRHSLEQNATTLVSYAWLMFFLAIFTMNIGWTYPSRLLLLAFMVTVTLSAILLLAALIRHNNQTIKRHGKQFLFFIPLLYAVASSYAASDFFIMSGVKLDDSPVLSLWVKMLYFCGFLALAVYLVYGLIYLVSIKDGAPKRVILYSSFYIVVVLITMGFTQRISNFLVIIQDYAIAREWQTTYICADREWQQPQERYFRSDDANWAVYFSGRAGLWGFEHLHCTPGSDGKPNETRQKLEGPHPMPKWFKE